MKHHTNKLRSFFNNFFKAFTLSKLLGGIITAFVVTSIKYYLSGSIYIDYSDFSNNFGLALLAWTLNTGIISFLNEYLGIRGINFNLKEFMFGFDTMNCHEESPAKPIKPKRFLAMDMDENLDPNKGLDKGKGIDKGHDQGKDEYEGLDEYQSLDSKEFTKRKKKLTLREKVAKLKERWRPYDPDISIRKLYHSYSDSDSEDSSTYSKKTPLKKNVNTTEPKMPKLSYEEWLKTLSTSPPVEPPMAAWNRVFPGKDPSCLIPKTNPGPGFNVPGGEVPIRDPICANIGYNSHILSQFKKMDLETAVEQRYSYNRMVRFKDLEINYARNALNNLLSLPISQQDINLKSRIETDLLELQKIRNEGVGKIILLTSRIDYIESCIKQQQQQT